MALAVKKPTKAKSKAKASGRNSPTPCRTGFRSFGDLLAETSSRTGGRRQTVTDESSQGAPESAEADVSATVEAAQVKKEPAPSKSRQPSRSRSPGRGDAAAKSELVKQEVKVQQEVMEDSTPRWISRASLQAREIVGSSSSRRPQRLRLPVMETWRNECATYNLGQHGFEITGVRMPSETEPKVLRRHPLKADVARDDSGHFTRRCRKVKSERPQEAKTLPDPTPQPALGDESSRPQHRDLKPLPSALRKSRATEVSRSISWKLETELVPIEIFKFEDLWTEQEMTVECDTCSMLVQRPGYELEGEPGSSRFAQSKVVCSQCKANSYISMIGGWTIVALASRAADAKLDSMGEGPIREYLQRLIDLTDPTGLPSGKDDVLVKLLGEEVADPDAKNSLLEKAVTMVTQTFGSRIEGEEEISEEDDPEAEEADRIQS